jgi:hypothetical protein
MANDTRSMIDKGFAEMSSPERFASDKEQVKQKSKSALDTAAGFRRDLHEGMANPLKAIRNIPVVDKVAQGGIDAIDNSPIGKWANKRLNPKE